MLRALTGLYARLVGQGALEERDAFAGTVRFIAMGLVSTGVYFVAILALHALGLTPRRASAAALVLCWGVSWLAQRSFTFRAGETGTAEIVRFVAMSLAGLLLAHLTIVFVHERGGMPLWFAAACVCVAIPVLNFLLMNFWVFRPGRIR
jgi:putative flippase GtrA